MTANLRTLVIGIGNPTRQDDAAGPLLARKVDELGLAEVDVHVAQQLTPEMAADWARRVRVLVIDAAVTGPEVDFRQVEATPDPVGNPASHGADPGTLAALAVQLYGRGPQVWLCTLRAESLDFGEAPTPAMRLRIAQAEQHLRQWLRDFS